MTPGSATLSVIFAVDDDEFDREAMVRGLAEARIPNPCRTFSSGEEMLDSLIAVLRGGPPPLVCFIDVKMAGMSGLDVLRWIRAQNALHAVPVVMLSSIDAPPLLAEALQFGAQCYVSKFPSAEQLREIVAAAEQYADAATLSVPFSVQGNLLRGQLIGRSVDLSTGGPVDR